MKEGRDEASRHARGEIELPTTLIEISEPPLARGDLEHDGGNRMLFVDQGVVAVSRRHPHHVGRDVLEPVAGLLEQQR